MYDVSYYESIVRNVFTLGDKMLKAADQALHLSVAVFDDNRLILTGMSTWAGSGHKPDSRGFLYGPSKASELILGDELDTEYSVTPIGGYIFSSHVMGGVRKRVGDVHYLVAASGWAQEADLLFALTLLYAMENEMSFHHVGFGYDDEVELTRVVTADISRFSSLVMVKPVSDHNRYYVAVRDPLLGYGRYYREHQIGGSVKPENVHWDVVVESPETFLKHIGSYLGGLDYWGYSPDASEGAVWVDNRGVPFGIMARREWWDIK